jgi:tetratricopeptide (TPR) repeat protein
MGPEQAEGRLEAVGPASDIYSLGATLYCLLAGRPPIDATDVAEALGKVQRADYPPPRAINRRVPAGLEAVALKAMARRPGDRYGSARELARDVERWLADEPVSAHREPWAARSRRWTRRHRTFVGGAAVLLVAAVIGLSVGAALLQRARVETDKQRRAAVTARNRAEAINRFLIDDLLKQADPDNNPAGDQLTVLQLLDKAAARLEAGAGRGLEPEVEAEVRAVIGHAYERLGASARAEPHYARAWELRSRLLGADHPEALAARNRLVFVVADQGRTPEAATLARAAYEACTRALGPTHPLTADATDNLGTALELQSRFDEAVALHRQASSVAAKALGPDDVLTLEIDNNLATSLVRAGRPAEAAPILQSVIDRRQRVTPRNPELANALGNLGGTLIALGRFTDAEALLKEALELNVATAGPLSQKTLGTRNLAAYALEGQRRWDEAEQAYLAVLADRRRLDGARPPSNTTQRTLAFLARLYAKQRRWPDAARLLAAVVLAQHPDPKRRPDTLAASLTAALSGTAEPSGAVPTLAECREALKAPLWGGDWLSAEVASRYGEYLRRQGRFAEAEPILIAAAAEVQKGVGVPPWGVAAARRRVAELYEAWGRPSDAARWQ